MFGTNPTFQPYREVNWCDGRGGKSATLGRSLQLQAIWSQVPQSPHPHTLVGRTSPTLQHCRIDRCTNRNSPGLRARKRPGPGLFNINLTERSKSIQVSTMSIMSFWQTMLRKTPRTPTRTNWMLKQPNVPSRLLKIEQIERSITLPQKRPHQVPTTLKQPRVKGCDRMTIRQNPTQRPLKLQARQQANKPSAANAIRMQCPSLVTTLRSSTCTVIQHVTTSLCHHCP